ncbi:hypothetical protein B7463_g10700, partial [Scytalidium lignicola]
TAHIFKLKVNTLRKAIQRQLTPIKKANKPSGRPPFLKPHQIEALCAHIRTQAYDGNPLNRVMVIRAATRLNSSGEEPSGTWLRRFLKDNPAFHIITTKPIEKERIQAQDKEEIKQWFLKYEDLKYENKVERCDIYNMDETSFRVGVTLGEEVIVLVEIKELYEGTFQNRKSVIVIECVLADGKAPIPLVILVEEIIVRYAFRESGIWPIEVEKTLAKLHVYSTPDQPKELEPTLPALLATPKTACYSVQALEELETCIPEVFSSPSAHQYLSTIKESQIKKIYLEDLKEWRAKERERKAAIRRITQGKKTKQHLVLVYLLVETPNKPADPATLKGIAVSVDEEQEVDFILDSTYNYRPSQYITGDNVVEQPGTVVSDPWVVDTTSTVMATITIATTTATTATKPSWLDQDFMGFEE